jgi:hypothetical protein
MQYGVVRYYFEHEADTENLLQVRQISSHETSSFRALIFVSEML